MSDSKLEIKIIEDQQGAHIDLDNLSVDASKSLQIILESFTRIAQEENNEDFSISIKKGSACIALSAPETKLHIVHKKVIDVLEYNSSNETYVESLKAIQQRVGFKDFKFEIIYSDSQNNEIVDLLPGFKQNRKFSRKKRIARKNQPLKIKFIQGKLYEIGGKRPNIHIQQGLESHKIKCTELQAKKVKGLLYNEDVMFSAWETIGADKKTVLTYCDNYVNKDLFDELESFMVLNLNQNGTKPIKDLHNILVENIKIADFGKVKKIIKLFKTELTDVNRLRAILLCTKPFKDRDDLNELLISVFDLIEKKLKKV
ncbi:hypothetical protein [Olleya sp. Hel_I_94]|uniref:hypothetical protein n=1 Tax=Olleya sp. Hel_I_94 TaxID=1250001 RepID=UPI00119CCB83|nr:hypothetical protein [Olleya sp. Hel_I_94]TVZ47976.1 hypothetical protein JM82_2606 [Olleya sp. Hel_I_94]